jgi:hypothetical protein
MLTASGFRSQPAGSPCRMALKGNPLTAIAARHVHVGDYFCSDQELYRVEQLVDGHALVEDCRSGALIDMPLSALLALEPVARG